MPRQPATAAIGPATAPPAIWPEMPKTTCATAPPGELQGHRIAHDGERQRIIPPAAAPTGRGRPSASRARAATAQSASIAASSTTQSSHPPLAHGIRHRGRGRAGTGRRAGYRRCEQRRGRRRGAEIHRISAITGRWRGWPARPAKTAGSIHGKHAALAAAACGFILRSAGIVMPAMLRRTRAGRIRGGLRRAQGGCPPRRPCPGAAGTAQDMAGPWICRHCASKGSARPIRAATGRRWTG